MRYFVKQIIRNGKKELKGKINMQFENKIKAKTAKNNK